MKSFIQYSEECHFPIQNLPYGIFSSNDNDRPRGGVAIGGQVLDLAELEKAGLLHSNYFSSTTLNSFMAAGKSEWSVVRKRLQKLLSNSYCLTICKTFFVLYHLLFTLLDNWYMILKNFK